MAEPQVPSQRLVSLDALRGFDLFWILGADEVVHALSEAWPIPPLRWAADQLDHVPWAGLHAYDCIFPLFVFMAGVSAAIALPRHLAQTGRAATVRHVLARTVILFLLGILYNGGLSHGWAGVRVMGVLQRIGLAYGAAGLLFCFARPRTLAAIAVALLLGYWALLAWVPVRDFSLEKHAVAARLGVEKPSRAEVTAAFQAATAYVRGRYDPGLNLANELDFEVLPGRMYDTYSDPEGLLSTIPAVSTCLLGVLAGAWLLRSDRTPGRKTLVLALSGAGCLAAALAWAPAFPIVKKIWSSSFVLAAGGWSLLLLALFYWVVDVAGWRAWCRPFVWIGMNPITLYLASSLIPFGRIAARFVGPDSDVAVATAALALVLLLAWFLHSRKIFLRV